MSFAKRRHLSVPDRRAAMSSLELGSSQEESAPTPSILILSPPQAAGSDDGYSQSAGSRRRKSTAKSTGRRKEAKLSGSLEKTSTPAYRNCILELTQSWTWTRFKWPESDPHIYSFNPTQPTSKRRG